MKKQDLVNILDVEKLKTDLLKEILSKRGSTEALVLQAVLSALRNIGMDGWISGNSSAYGDMRAAVQHRVENSEYQEPTDCPEAYIMAIQDVFCTIMNNPYDQRFLDLRNGILLRYEKSKEIVDPVHFSDHQKIPSKG
jgi:hypothetical protein